MRLEKLPLRNSAVSSTAWATLVQNVPAGDRWADFLNVTCYETAWINAVAVLSLFYLLGGCVTANDRKANTLVIGLAVWISAVSIAHGFTGCGWMYTTVNLHCPMSNYDPRHYIRGELRVNIGLSFYNVTFRSVSADHAAPNMAGVGDVNEWGHVVTLEDVMRMQHMHATEEEGEEMEEEQDPFYYRERFSLRPPTQEGNRVVALDKGLPEAMVIVTEYMDMKSGGAFHWGMSFPKAGYFAWSLLCFSTIALVLCGAFLVLIPKYGVYLLFVCGMLCVATVYQYVKMLEGFRGEVPPIFVFGRRMDFYPSVSLYLLLIVGAIDIVTSIVFLLIHASKGKKPESLATFFELDFDTPWDNRKLVEDSKNRRCQYVAPERPTSFLRVLRDSLRRSTMKKKNKEAVVVSEVQEEEAAADAVAVTEAGDHHDEDDAVGRESGALPASK